jgi:hypothetical protein
MDLVRLYLTYLLDKVWSNQIAIKYQNKNQIHLKKNPNPRIHTSVQALF